MGFVAVGVRVLWRPVCLRCEPSHEKNQAKKELYETMLLEKTLKKIGGLLQVGFGFAGSEIIGKNMGAEVSLRDTYDIFIATKNKASLTEHLLCFCNLSFD